MGLFPEKDVTEVLVNKSKSAQYLSRYEDHMRISDTMKTTKFVVVFLVLTAALFLSLFLHLGYTFKLNYFNLHFNRSTIKFLADIIPVSVTYPRNSRVERFKYDNGTFKTNYLYNRSRNKNFVRNETIRLPKALLFTSSDAPVKNRSNLSAVSSTYNEDQEKLILIYTKSYGERWLPKSWPRDGDLFFLDSPDFTCPRKCVFTDNKNFSSMADAVLFGVLDTLYHSKDEVQKYPKPSERKKDQIWIASTFEPALYHDVTRIKELNYMFNWTATFRLDSDIYWPYGFFYKLKEPKRLEETNLPNATVLKSKRLAASMISNCDAWGGRDIVLNSLKKYMDIDSYGKCGDKQCPNNTQCREYLGDHYKFFLAFENSLCQDYVTEKFFASFPVGMVPVTYGLGNYAHIAPPHSYINALDFPNTNALAEYLLHLDKNDDEYLAYFDWRKNYAMGDNGDKVQFCALCMKLWEPITPKRIPEGFNTWWRHKRNDTVDGNNGTLTYKLLHDFNLGCVSKEAVVLGGRYISKLA